MKMNKFIPAGLLALALAPLTALATPTVIHVTAGTAFRPAVEAAIINILNSPTAAFVGASLPKATSAVIAGTLKNGPSAGQGVVFEILWAGSNAGVAAAAQQSPVVTDVFPTATNSSSSVSLVGSAGSYTFSGATSLSSGSVITENAQPDVVPSITFQASTIFFGTGYNTLNDAIVGVAPLVWVRGNAATSDGTTTSSNSSFASITNITTQQANNLLAGGLPLSQFTNNPADQGTAIEAIGRDEDSGQRIVAFDEVGYGSQSTPQQYQPTVGTGSLSTVITAINLWPANPSPIDGVVYNIAGHSGYNSATTQAADLSRKVAPGLGTFLISYFSLSDAANVTTGAQLSYNGVAESTAAVQQGTYTFWAYEHILSRAALTGVASDAVTALSTQILNTDAAQGGVLLNDPNFVVGRTVEGGQVTFGNPY